MAEQGKAAPVTVPPIPEELESRESIYKKYAEQNGGTPEETKEETAPPVEEKPATTEKVEPEQTAAEPEKVEAQPKPKEEKTVPYNALHEERLKRQAEARIRKDAEARAKALEEELNRLKSQEKQPPEEITDYEKELIELKQKQRAMEAVLEREQVEKKENARRSALDQFNRTMIKIDTELKAEGIVGFAYHKDAVANEIKNLLMEDEANQILDNEEGWKKIYQEKFYPSFIEEMKSVEKKAAVTEKTELKKNASLGTIPGKAPAKPKSVDDLSPEEMKAKYLETRRAREY